MRRLNQYSKDLSREVLDLIVSSMNYTKHFKQQNIINFRYVDDTTLMAESKEELKGDEGETGERKSWLKIQYSEN